MGPRMRKATSWGSTVAARELPWASVVVACTAPEAPEPKWYTGILTGAGFAGHFLLRYTSYAVVFMPEHTFIASLLKFHMYQVLCL